MTSFALLIVDMQRDFVCAEPGCKFFDRDADNVALMPAVVLSVRHLLDGWRATNFGVRVFVQSHYAFKQFRQYPELCLAGSRGAELVFAPIAGSDSEFVFTKHVHDAFATGALAAELTRRGVTRVFICGVTTNHCVQATAVGCVKSGFETVVVADAIGTTFKMRASNVRFIMAPPQVWVCVCRVCVCFYVWFRKDVRRIGAGRSHLLL